MIHFFLRRALFQIAVEGLRISTLGSEKGLRLTICQQASVSIVHTVELEGGQHTKTTLSEIGMQLSLHQARQLAELCSALALAGARMKGAFPVPVTNQKLDLTLAVASSKTPPFFSVEQVLADRDTLTARPWPEQYRHRDSHLGLFSALSGSSLLHFLFPREERTTPSE